MHIGALNQLTMQFLSFKWLPETGWIFADFYYFSTGETVNVDPVFFISLIAVFLFVVNMFFF